MSKTRLVITAVVIHNQPVAHVAATYGVSRSWLYELLARYRTEGDAVFEPRSRRPKSVPNAVPAEVVDLILELREKLSATGLDAGPETIRWHLKHHHAIEVGRTTISRYLQAHGLVVPEPKKKPKSSYIRFQAAMPNETWQSDFTHYRLTRPDGRPGADCEILTWLDDCSRYALSVTAHHRVTGTIVLSTFRETLAEHGIPASTLTDNGMVFTTRLSQGKKGAGTRNGFETELRRLNIVQKNGRPNHPTTQGKVERFQQTMKKWLRAQPDQPTTIDDLQALLDAFVEEYNDHRWFAPDLTIETRVSITQHPTGPPTPTGGSEDAREGQFQRRCEAACEAGVEPVAEVRDLVAAGAAGDHDRRGRGGSAGRPVHDRAAQGGRQAGCVVGARGVQARGQDPRTRLRARGREGGDRPALGGL
jgi:transposase InsO family protein